MKKQSQSDSQQEMQLEFGFEAEAPQKPATPAVDPIVETSEPKAPCRVASTATYKEIRDDFLQRMADALHLELTNSTGIDLRLRITNNTSTMMSLRYESGGRRGVVGLHHMFLEAPPDVRKALSAWIIKPSAKVPGKKLETYIAEQRHLIASKTPRSSVLRTKGEFFDLAAIYKDVNESCYNNEITTPITWGRMPAMRRRRSIRFGSFSPGENLIRMHPLLDQSFVPQYFVRYIVFHEMLHAHMGIEETPGGRRKIHPPEFRRREAAYPDFKRALCWMEDERNLRRLLRSTRG